jgi:hypothetical protein
MNHLSACIVPSLCNDKWLANKMYQLTMCQQHQLVSREYQVVTLENFNEVNQYTSTSKWLFIQSAGDFIVDRDHVWDLLHSIPDNVGLIGHILWDPSATTPHLHHQCIIINTAALKGQQLDFYGRLPTGLQFTRSAESMHGDYCPAWVGLNDNVEFRDPKFGTDVMSLILANGYNVVNFDSEWRSVKNTKYLSHMPSRGYFSPELNTALFSRCLKTLTVSDQLELEQYEAITVLKNESEYRLLNALHWDGYPEVGAVDTVICPANGFMGECMANDNQAKKIIFFDVNANNIEFKKQLYAEWDGNNYKEFYTKFADERNLMIDPFTEDAKENAVLQDAGVKNIIDNWDKFKNMDVEFIHGDIIEIVDLILNKFDGRTILHTSTILNFYLWSNLKHDLDVIQHTRDKIAAKVNNTNNVWFESV